jgi:hypothetical protein
MGVSLLRGPAGGTWRTDAFTGDFEKQVKEGSGGGGSLFVVALRGGHREGSFTGNFERYVREGSGNGTSFSM